DRGRPSLPHSRQRGNARPRHDRHGPLLEGAPHRAVVRRGETLVLGDAVDHPRPGARSARYPAAIARVTSVTGTPTRAWPRQSIAIPRRAAASTTMTLAMLPTMNRLPAKVLTSARVAPASECAALGSSNMTAG